MSFELPLVFFTILSQLAVGLGFFVCCSNLKNTNPETTTTGWTWVFVLAAAGLISSLFHLGHPLQAYKALNSLGISWLSREVLLLSLFCALAFINIFMKSRIIGVIATILGILGIIAQGITYAPPSIPAIHNAFPLATFLFSTAALGACAWAALETRATTLTSRATILALAVISVGAPAMWISGTATMLLSAELWLTSPLFWFGMVLLILAFMGSYSKDFSAKFQLCSLFSGLLLTRMVFFANTVHTASNIGFPYS